MVDTPVHIVRNDEDAWKLLSAALKGEVQISGPESVKFVGWPHLNVHVKERESAISPSMMEAFVDLQKALYRSQALVKYDTADMRLLTDEDKASVEMEVRVSEGSANYDVDLQALAMKMLEEAATKMEPVHFLILILGAGLLFAGTVVFNNWIQTKAETRQREVSSEDIKAALEALKHNSEQDTVRTRLLTEALQQQPKLVVIRNEADNARTSLLRGITDEGEVTVQGTVLDGEVASELLRRERNPSKKVAVEGVFNILRVDTTSADGFRVQLRHVDTGEVITAGVQDVFLSEEQRRVIQEAEWEKAPVRAKIDAFRVGGNYSRAVIKSAEKVKKVAPSE